MRNARFIPLCSYTLRSATSPSHLVLQTAMQPDDSVENCLANALFHELSLPLALVRCRCRAMVICGPTATAGSQRFFYNG